ncbi:MAG: S-layer homology domain-containing protein [Chroococcales cyanobacterium]
MSACTNTESLFAPDSKLKENPVSLNESANESPTPSQPNPSPVRSPQNSTIQSVTQTPTPEQSEPPQLPSGETLEVSTVEEAPEQLRPYVKDVADLGILMASEGNETDAKAEFNPNEPITRRDFARWLVTANNKLYANQPGQQIRLVKEADTPAFQDVSQNDPDFAVIQGLAEAGLIPSRLTGDSTKVLFRPDAPLNREDLVLWKVPLDRRQGLPNASIESVKETWGFQDTAKVDPKVLSALLADFENGEQSNIRRVFGYTTIFQPDKPVTRAEAVATLWYFGTAGEGISAEEALEIQDNQNQP